MKFCANAFLATAFLGAAADASAQAGPGDERAPAQLAPVQVLGSKASGYTEPEATGATRTETPLREVPQSVRVVTRQLLDDLGATRLADSFDHVSGVSRQNDFGGAWDNFSIRGFSGNENTGPNFLRNGLGGNRGISAPRDLANVDRIEFLKGPSAAVYGSSEPGGTLNIVTKKPLFQPAASASLELGSWSRRRLAADATGPLADGLAYRLNLAAEEADSFRDEVHTRRLLVAPALAWKLDADTTLGYDGEYLRQAAPFDRGIVAVRGRLGALPASRFLGEPADGDLTVVGQTHTATLERRLGPQWQLRAALSYREGSLEGFSTEATALQADNATLRRQRRFRDHGSEDLSAQAEAIGKFTIAGVSQQAVVGLDTYRFRYDTRLLRINPSAAAPYAIDIYTPVYGQRQPTPLPNTDTSEHQDDTALYLQDEASLGAQWRLLAGLRLDRYRQRLENFRTGLTTHQAQSATTPRLGLTYLASPTWSLYATTGRSFRPNAGVDANGGAFAPERGRAVEAGAKYERTDHGLSATLAVFDIAKRNALTADPANSGFSQAAGEVRSRGVEFDGAGQLTRELRLTANWAFIDAKVTRDASIPVGTRLVNVPRNSGSTLAVWEDALPGGGRYGVGAGLTHVGARTGDALGSFLLPGYTTARLLSFWQPHPAVRVAFDVDNAFDRTYFASSYSAVWIAPGTPRRFTLSVLAKI